MKEVHCECYKLSKETPTSVSECGCVIDVKFAFSQQNLAVIRSASVVPHHMEELFENKNNLYSIIFALKAFHVQEVARTAIRMS